MKRPSQALDTGPASIRNREAVISFYGDWPLFHDANVVAYDLAPQAESVCLTLHTWRMTDEVDGKGYFIRRNHALVSFRFGCVHDLEMDAFGSANILFSMKISPCSGSDSFRVELDSLMDMSGSFSARSGEVVSIIPCTPEGLESKD